MRVRCTPWESERAPMLDGIVVAVILSPSLVTGTHTDSAHTVFRSRLWRCRRWCGSELLGRLDEDLPVGAALGSRCCGGSGQAQRGACTRRRHVQLDVGAGGPTASPTRQVATAGAGRAGRSWWPTRPRSAEEPSASETRFDPGCRRRRREEAVQGAQCRSSPRSQDRVPHLGAQSGSEAWTDNAAENDVTVLWEPNWGPRTSCIPTASFIDDRRRRSAARSPVVAEHARAPDPPQPRCATAPRVRLVPRHRIGLYGGGYRPMALPCRTRTWSCSSSVSVAATSSRRWVDYPHV